MYSDDDLKYEKGSHILAAIKWIRGVRCLLLQPERKTFSNLHIWFFLQTFHLYSAPFIWCHKKISFLFWIHVRKNTFLVHICRVKKFFSLFFSSLNESVMYIFTLLLFTLSDPKWFLRMWAHQNEWYHSSFSFLLTPITNVIRCLDFCIFFFRFLQGNFSRDLRNDRDIF